MAQRTQPAWEKPSNPNAVRTGLRLHNSLTREVDEFIPANGNTVNAYICGPTVYDASHMGHASTYIQFDVIRRVLADYFHYDMRWVMNITDVDDKIILKARRNHLFEEYVAKALAVDQVRKDIAAALEFFAAKTNALAADDGKRDFRTKLADKVTALLANAAAPASELCDAARDALAEWLDSQFGASVTDPAIFAKTARYWEEQFNIDMKALHILEPDRLTRVSDYIDEIIEFVEKVIGNGYAYASNGSVYFSTTSFDQNKGHHYAKLVPEAVGNAASLAEGEGELSATDAGSDKKHPNDFALWKKSKAGEPAWDSPWGKGRPGWHIECSAMAGKVIGSTLDIHGGGIDLKFPHHDNEIAQSEAFFDNKQWINYFMHTGHLAIEGRKMSKSLKNFITIREALEAYTARQIRIMFLLHAWNKGLDYSKSTMTEAISVEKSFNEFFLNIKAALQSAPANKFVAADEALEAKLRATKQAIHEAFLNSINTPAVFGHLQDLVSATNTYLNTPGNVPKSNILRGVGNFATWILSVVGVIPNGRAGEIGFPIGGADGASADIVLLPAAKTIAAFRDVVRKEARASKATALLQACDALRDETLPQLGIRLEDVEGGDAVVKIVDREEIMREKQREKEAREAAAAAKEEAKRKAAEDKAKKDAQNSINPAEMFLSATDKYSKFDEKGIPTHDAAGVEVAKSARKKLEKAFEQQTKAYETHLKQKANGASTSGTANA
ncbi:cysteinyl-tRNA synthetase [Capsaspora owczarzaki ATCC 30864]|uniref:cysteine--tRNA ligase n=1 Tax=Capsaspora owczarzaki (strain ATCC 30864) TaxID=595528 RepID=A0A0D2X5A6_CAPO3|nr:cysteinyl-tRNA synthetase [Capsaspora owczarzaki ATCC 30864]KJE97474.1 cysteinyl-tRNA synthetase [Capsaspora owczarzaki ATCC 30864]|eukprot:XP_004343187.1 cysteinyl-tRNA synthetase [Capsaspora owczarzaki ATCC 30864]